MLFMALRFALVAILLLPFAKRPEGQWGAVFAIAVTLGLLHFSFMFHGLKTVDAGTASIAIQLQVPFASLLAAIVFQDKLGWRRALGVAIAFIGDRKSAVEGQRVPFRVYLGGRRIIKKKKTKTP